LSSSDWCAPCAAATIRRAAPQGEPSPRDKPAPSARQRWIAAAPSGASRTPFRLNRVPGLMHLEGQASSDGGRLGQSMFLLVLTTTGMIFRLSWKTCQTGWAVFIRTSRIAKSSWLQVGELIRCRYLTCATPVAKTRHFGLSMSRKRDRFSTRPQVSGKLSGPNRG